MVSSLGVTLLDLVKLSVQTSNHSLLLVRASFSIHFPYIFHFSSIQYI